MQGGPRPTHRLACIAWSLLAACSSHSSARDTATDTVSDPELDPAGDELHDPATETTPVDAIPDDVEWEEVDWEDCTPPTVLDTRISVQPDPGITEVSIEADGQVVDIGEDTSGRMMIEVDFTASDPELGTAVFILPGWVAGISDLTTGDEVHIVFHYFSWFWNIACITVIRDGSALIAGFENDDSCQPFHDTFSWEIDDLDLVHGASMCEPWSDDCVSWLRLYYDVSCPGLGEPVRILDGSEADVACGAGYRVMVSRFHEHYRWVDYCTDMPPWWVHVMVVRHAE